MSTSRKHLGICKLFYIHDKFGLLILTQIPFGVKCYSNNSARLERI